MQWLRAPRKSELYTLECLRIRRLISSQKPSPLPITSPFFAPRIWGLKAWQTSGLTERSRVNKWGKRSRLALDTCDYRLQRVADIVLQIKDHSILVGARTEQEQRIAYAEGYSQVQFPNSKHNITDERPRSLALDMCPYPVDWDDREDFLYLAGLYIGVGAALGYTLRSGGDWDMDGILNKSDGSTFDDLGHVEIVEDNA